MSSRAAITIMRPRPEVEELWRDPTYRPPYIDSADTAVRFVDGPGDRGTEVHVDLLKTAPGGKLGEAVQKLLGTEPLAKVKDDLRRFKQHVETGEIPRSDGTPGGECLESKLRQRPAQPLSQEELQEVGVRCARTCGRAAVRRANMEDPRRKIHEGSPAVKPATASPISA